MMNTREIKTALEREERAPARRAFVVVNDEGAVGIFWTFEAAIKHASKRFEDFQVNDCPIFER